jgi:hypothetical protein
VSEAGDAWPRKIRDRRLAGEAARLCALARIFETVRGKRRDAAALTCRTACQTANHLANARIPDAEEITPRFIMQEKERMH